MRSDHICLYWKQERYHHTVLLDPVTNVATLLYAAPGYQNVTAFCSTMLFEPKDDLIGMSTVISDDEDDKGESSPT